MGNTRRFRNSVGPAICKRRLALKLTQDQLTTRLQLAGLDIERTAVAKIEGRVRSVFDYELFVISQTLGMDAGELAPPERELRRRLPLLLQGHIPAKR
jgi:transcriptional regulator with XRE-family HTH domain